MAMRSILITSFKGGVGKSTVSANLAVALARMGKKVLAVDCDFKMRCLDLILGCENRVLYDLGDFFEGRVPFENMVLRHETIENVYLAPAPYDDSVQLTPDRRQALIKAATDFEAFDYILFDTPGETGGQMSCLASLCDTALVVANHHTTSIRAAEKTAMTLKEQGMENRFLLVNFYETSRSDAPSLLSIIDRAAVRLLGLIPFDRQMAEKQDSGLFPESVGKKASNAGIAFSNIASRLEGKSVPLGSGFRGIDRKKLIR